MKILKAVEAVNESSEGLQNTKKATKCDGENATATSTITKSGLPHFDNSPQGTRSE